MSGQECQHQSAKRTQVQYIQAYPHKHTQVGLLITFEKWFFQLFPFTCRELGRENIGKWLDSAIPQRKHPHLYFIHSMEDGGKVLNFSTFYQEYKFLRVVSSVERRKLNIGCLFATLFVVACKIYSSINSTQLFPIVYCKKHILQAKLLTGKLCSLGYFRETLVQTSRKIVYSLIFSTYFTWLSPSSVSSI